MTHSTSSLLGVAALLSLTAACSTAQVRPEQATHTAIACEGGTVRTASDADRFRPCDSIRGDLRIEGTELEDLWAFANVRSVSRTLTIAHNHSLETLAQLRHLRNAQSVVLEGNPKLTDLKGLEGLTQTHRLVLGHNGVYRTTGLESLRSVGELVITGNPNLLSLAGLNHLKHAGSVEITMNQRLCAQPGLLPALSDVRSPLIVSQNLGVSSDDVSALSKRAQAATTVSLNSDG